MATLRLTDAQAALVAEHTDVIDQVIVRYFRPAFGVDYQRADAWQDGWIGLADAARRFDPSYEVLKTKSPIKFRCKEKLLRVH